MSYTPKSLYSIIQLINRDLFLPHIQRPFVWDKDQMSKLFDSLMRVYPIQTFLFWKTDEEIKARKFMDIVDIDIDLHTLYDSNKSQAGNQKIFVLDGQQRLQTLLCLFNGSYKNEITNVTEEAYIDLTSKQIDPDTGQIFNVKFFPDQTPQPLPLFRIKDIMGKYNRNSNYEISNKINDELNTILNDTGTLKIERERTINENVSRIISILREDRYFWIDELDGLVNQYPYKTILEIFVRVNSGGTRLNASDLMFAAMKELSPDIESNLEEIADSLSIGNLQFEIDSILKGILLVYDKGASLDHKKFSGDDGKKLLDLIDNDWDLKIKPAFEGLRDFIVTDLKNDSDKILRSYNSIVPIFEYFYFNPTPTPDNKSRLKSYYYRAQIFNWFSSQTDGILDYLHNKFLKGCTKKDFPISEINDYFKVNRKKIIQFDKNTLSEHSLRYFFLHLLYIESHNLSAFNVKMKNNAPHIDHIYPNSKLKKPPFSLLPQEINHIGNYRFVGATDNIRKRAENPDSYFGRLKTSNINIEKHLLIKTYSDDPKLLKMDLPTYRDFRDKRFDMIYSIIEPILNFI